MNQTLSRKRVIPLFGLTLLFLIPTFLMAQNSSKKTVGDKSECIVTMYSADVSMSAQQRETAKSLAAAYVHYQDSVNLRLELSLLERVTLKQAAFAKMDSSIVNGMTSSQKQAVKAKRSEQATLLDSKKN